VTVTSPEARRQPERLGSVPIGWRSPDRFAIVPASQLIRTRCPVEDERRIDLERRETARETMLVEPVREARRDDGDEARGRERAGRRRAVLAVPRAMSGDEHRAGRDAGGEPRIEIGEEVRRAVRGTREASRKDIACGQVIRERQGDAEQRRHARIGIDSPGHRRRL
jgi:hypothetical protein